MFVGTDERMGSLPVIHLLLTVLNFKDRNVPLDNHNLYEPQASQQTLLINLHGRLVSFHSCFLPLCLGGIVAIRKNDKRQKDKTME